MIQSTGFAQEHIQGEKRRAGGPLVRAGLEWVRWYEILFLIH